MDLFDREPGGYLLARISGCAASTLHPSRVFAAANAPGAPSSLASSVNGATVTLTWLAPTSLDPATNGTINGSNISLTFPADRGRVATFIGTVTGNRMTGTVVGSDPARPGATGIGTFAVTRQ